MTSNYHAYYPSIRTNIRKNNTWIKGCFPIIIALTKDLNITEKEKKGYSDKQEAKCSFLLTVEYKLPSGNISSSAVFGYTLVHAGILWAKIWNFQNPAGVVDFNLAREWISISSSPWDGRHRAAEVKHKEVTQATFSCSTMTGKTAAAVFDSNWGRCSANTPVDCVVPLTFLRQSIPVSLTILWRHEGCQETEPRSLAHIRPSPLHKA